MEKSSEAKEAGSEKSRLLKTLGLCARAGALVYGTDMICDAMRRGVRCKTPLLVIEASDTSENTRKKLNDKCKYYNVRLAVVPYGSAALGAAVGKRRPLAAAGITDAQLKRAVEMQIDNNGSGA
jgi:ribosomal protein L7Ae-like RNA K-turn-binding protein